MTDPDAPSKESNYWSQYCHYVISDIPAPKSSNFVTNVDFNQVEELLPYLGPSPPSMTGPHRYVILLFKQNHGQSPESPGDNRVRWGTGIQGHGAKEWAEKNGLTTVGANFFYTSNEKQHS